MSKVVQLKAASRAACATRIRANLKDRDRAEAEIAADLREVLDELGEVEWLAWCAEEFGWSRSTAYKHLNPEQVKKERARAETNRQHPYGTDIEPRAEPLEEDEDPQNYRTMYFLRAEQAARFAVYSGPIITADMVAYARTVAAAWEQLACKLETSL